MSMLRMLHMPRISFNNLYLNTDIINQVFLIKRELSVKSLLTSSEGGSENRLLLLIILFHFLLLIFIILRPSSLP